MNYSKKGLEFEMQDQKLIRYSKLRSKAKAWEIKCTCHENLKK